MFNFGEGGPVTPGTWTMRRRFMFVVIAFCMACISWVLYKNLTSEIAETVVTMSFSVITFTMGSYVFGAIWDDQNVRNGNGN